jgi:hypothetical protein
MKNPSSCLLLLTLISSLGCGAAVDDAGAEGYSADGELRDENAWADDGEVEGAAHESDARTEDGATVIGSSRQPLISGGAGGVSAKPWCAARKECYDQCDRDYPSGGGPRTTCKQICDVTTASKCRPGFAGGGAVIF